MLVPLRQHPWNLAPREAIALQRELAALVIPTASEAAFQTVAGVDVSVVGARARAAVVVLALPHLEIVEQATAEGVVVFPYVPGLLSFREAPLILEALAHLQGTPDVLIFDGQGIAHPRRLGIAAHVGVLLDWPTLGCAKTRLCGVHEEPAPERGSVAWLREGEEVLGAVVRTRARVKPLFVSVGHRISLECAIALVLRCGKGYRLPEPTRWAHRLAGKGKR
jgi:deoxyribonuclease V